MYKGWRIPHKLNTFFSFTAYCFADVGYASLTSVDDKCIFGKKRHWLTVLITSIKGPHLLYMGVTVQYFLHIAQSQAHIARS